MVAATAAADGDLSLWLHFQPAISDEPGSNDRCFNGGGFFRGSHAIFMRVGPTNPVLKTVQVIPDPATADLKG
ncbi:5-methylthioadenosine/S-adenosylhomocysteine deaminase [Anopheles sinensis]|uniref:5-methylthioadenosine/S-adenosylhomocysteine deaminase n=1 Tax=Anopheles sinensis TaxID=74873 RepID=A0A084WV13_ANOSI|nr:5-methylthioadenosine/S-adenosylhomocysteine deaminase [Anopheles sinensis]